MSKIAQAIAEFRQTQGVKAAQALEVLLEDTYPEDVVVLDLVDALAQFHRAGNGGGSPLDETDILSLLERSEAYILQLSLPSATRASWKTLLSPVERAPLHIARPFSDSVGDRMKRGFVPRAMEDRWFIYCEDGWLNFHQSWTGAHIFAVRLDGASSGVRISDAWVSNDSAQYRSQGAEHDAALLLELIETHFGDAANDR